MNEQPRSGEMFIVIAAFTIPWLRRSEVFLSPLNGSGISNTSRSINITFLRNQDQALTTTEVA